MKTIERSHATSSAGFSLIEVITVMVIIGILSMIAVPAYNDWLRKSRIESQVRTMAAEFSELRLQAITGKQGRSITLNANNYIFMSYTSDADPGNIQPGGTRSVANRLMSDASTPYAGTILDIDQRGLLVSTPATIYVDGGGDTSATLNCLTVHTARVNPGWSATIGGTCNDR